MGRGEHKILSSWLHVSIIRTTLWFWLFWLISQVLSFALQLSRILTCISTKDKFWSHTTSVASPLLFPLSALIGGNQVRHSQARTLLTIIISPSGHILNYIFSFSVSLSFIQTSTSRLSCPETRKKKVCGFPVPWCHHALDFSRRAVVSEGSSSVPLRQFPTLLVTWSHTSPLLTCNWKMACNVDMGILHSVIWTTWNKNSYHQYTFFFYSFSAVYWNVL